MIYIYIYPENLCSKFVVRDQREWTTKVNKRPKSELLTKVRRILRLLVLRDTRARRGNLQQRKGNILPQLLFQSCIQKVNRNVERVNLLQVVALRVKSSQKFRYTQWRKRNTVKGEDEIILQLLMIYPQLMEVIQMTHNIRDLK